MTRPQQPRARSRDKRRASSGVQEQMNNGEMNLLRPVLRTQYPGVAHFVAHRDKRGIAEWYRAFGWITLLADTVGAPRIRPTPPFQKLPTHHGTMPAAQVVALVVRKAGFQPISFYS